VTFWVISVYGLADDTNVLGEYASYIFRVKAEYGEYVVRLSVGKVDHRSGKEDRTQHGSGQPMKT
jgi:Ser/Thr protein kinase RdoA (MazF antagonist)